jgi:hypothetical protein
MVLNRRARRALKPKGVRMAGRDSNAIQREYVEACAKLGEITLRSEQLREDLEGLGSDKNKTTQLIRGLQKEYQAYMLAQQSKSKENGDKANEELSKEASKELAPADGTSAEPDASGPASV